jgi:hypothetical protein
MLQGYTKKQSNKRLQSLLVAVLAINEVLRGQSVLPVTTRMMHCLMTPSLLIPDIRD